MFTNFNKLIYIAMLLLGSVLTISNNSMLGMWMGLEINMMSFIPMLSEKNNILSSEASLKYFLIQALSSSIFIMSSISMLNFSNLFPNIFENLIILSLMIKLGSAPFHFWFPSIIEGLSWFNCFILFTWQKIAPLMIVSYFINNYMIYLYIISSLIVGAIGGLNQSSIQKMIAYSSINHIGWMMSALKININMFMLYFLIYSIILLFIFNMMSTLDMMHMNQLVMFNNKSMVIKLIMMINFLSLGGLPPFLGFLPKWIIIQNLLYFNMFMLSLILILSSLMTLFYYIKIMMMSLMMNPSQQKNYSLNLSFNKLNKFHILLMMMISLYSLIFLPFLVWN
uniref:NADH-ubiquinone oxidoreductase chain 2 n=1 Tax=Homoeoxipha nigripes TaxID=2697520 RepID=A0A6B9VWT9_9ORTH|nr:NADH dehydrogenase subunit 2 [Homoeoxipha nigripes]QHQ73121.1 NADH dehydrogenase subunit 2 [Homoeoxipha nigripes]